MVKLLRLVCVATLLSNCTGEAGLFFGTKQGEDGPALGPSPHAPAPPSVMVRQGLRRLTRGEYADTVRDLLGAPPTSLDLLPEDGLVPFDNDHTLQASSAALIDGVESLAAQLAAALSADTARRKAIVPCEPAGAGDVACFERFLRSFGRKAFRRPLEADELALYATLRQHAVERNDFFVGVRLAVEAMLQSPSFLYRVERGEPVSGDASVVRLTSYEVATRLSYLFWGSAPPDWLLDEADRGGLLAPSETRDAATRLLADPRAKERVHRFHALWLGYHPQTPAAGLRAAQLQESRALVQRVVFDEPGDYLRLFSSEDTFIDASLASHYGLPAPSTGGFGWVRYGASDRRGILSHGAVLANGATEKDTSPVLRGIWVLQRLMCEDLPPPPPDAATDLPPPGDTPVCKSEVYAQHRSGACASCHSRIDPIGWGLERYDGQGRYRAVEPEPPHCAIDGQGELPSVGPFSGPGQLSSLLAGTQRLEQCVVRQVFRYAVGRRELPEEAPLLTELQGELSRSGRSFTELLLALASDESFFFRGVDEP